MKLLLKLVVVAAIINAAYHVGMAEYRFSQLKDSVHSILALGKDTPVEQLKSQTLQKAADLKLPVSAEKVTVSREGVRTSVTLSYQVEVEPFPGYTYPKDYSITDEIAAIR
jgi:hypothetical protein